MQLQSQGSGVVFAAFGTSVLDAMDVHHVLPEAGLEPHAPSTQLTSIQLILGVHDLVVLETNDDLSS